MLTVIIFILILGLLVFVHELGHFLIERRNGVTVEEFGFGFPPRIFGIKRRGTIYSINWIPLGGFVKITGEDGEPSYVPPGGTSAGKERENPKSFASKSPFTRIRILVAGVAMNFLLAAVLFSVGFWKGVPQLAEEVRGGSVRSEKIQIVEVGKNTPAETMGFRTGDEIFGAVGPDGNLAKFFSVEDVQNFARVNQGREVDLLIRRGKEELKLTGMPRAEYPEGEGPLGVALAKTAEVRYPWYQAIWKGIEYTFNITITFVAFLFVMLWRLIISQPIELDVSGPVGIAVLTGQVARLGFDYLLRFTAVLSVNLAIINILPIPALDGGRVLFILIEKFKGSPVSQKFEQRAHNFGFALLITLMILVTFRDIMKFDLAEKVKDLF